MISELSTQSGWVHNLDPFLIQFSETFGIRWYGLAYLTGFLLGYLIIRRIVKSGNSPLKIEFVPDLITYMVFGVMIGGRLGYCIFYRPELLTDFHASFPFWGALAVWEGGMASHGGFIGVFLGCVLFARKHKINFTHIGDLVVLGSTLGIFFGRVANFINGELVGRIVTQPVAWAVKFPQDLYGWLSHVKSVSWESKYRPRLEALADTVSEVGVDPDKWLNWLIQAPGSGSAQMQIQKVLNQLVMEIQNGNEAIRQTVGLVLDPRHPSQIYAALSEGLIPFLIILWLWKKARKPGFISGVYLTLYPISRVINEQFRMPDAHLGFQWLGLTRGQWLSLVMMVFSLAFLVWTQRQNTQALGGWSKRSTGAET